MKLQVALDEMNIEQGVDLISKVHQYVDIVEIGTPFAMAEGVHPVEVFKRKFNDIDILADTKIMDAGKYEAELAFRAGARYVTVLGVSDLGTIKGCLQAAEKYGGEVVVDMICVPDPAVRIPQLERIGVRNIAVHAGVDLQAQGRTALDDLKLMKSISRSFKIAVAGGINQHTVDDYLDAGADVIIVGGGIAHAQDPALEAELLANRIHKNQPKAA
ncbi:3-hexulose-6-phosphate synthase [Bifidobacterium sp. ESL0690]|uniref:3-hexulose-6-phosphate synthase n=1 Tax=Bifidobacterium sp. ESL0690 TaxID=2983214 RepID=UPI0023F69920|nr:3-hexulose-6-phosphate synthase [Bifidobacterium sp. ESL0690]WEV46880.1 3-hexulose-6-phosphate synthase [Bifidobacterium sp. ESL0690]